MPIRPIVITGNPVLHAKALEVTEFDQELRELVQDMFETMDEAPGVGLAAPQVGLTLGSLFMTGMPRMAVLNAVWS